MFINILLFAFRETDYVCALVEVEYEEVLVVNEALSIKDVDLAILAGTLEVRVGYNNVFAKLLAEGIDEGNDLGNVYCVDHAVLVVYELGGDDLEVNRAVGLILYLDLVAVAVDAVLKAAGLTDYSGSLVVCIINNGKLEGSDIAAVANTDNLTNSLSCGKGGYCKLVCMAGSRNLVNGNNHVAKRTAEGLRTVYGTGRLNDLSVCLILYDMRLIYLSSDVVAASVTDVVAVNRLLAESLNVCKSANSTLGDLIRAVSIYVNAVDVVSDNIDLISKGLGLAVGIETGVNDRTGGNTGSLVDHSLNSGENVFVIASVYDTEANESLGAESKVIIIGMSGSGNRSLNLYATVNAVANLYALRLTACGSLGAPLGNNVVSNSLYVYGLLTYVTGEVCVCRNRAGCDCSATESGDAGVILNYVYRLGHSNALKNVYCVVCDIGADYRSVVGICDAALSCARALGLGYVKLNCLGLKYDLALCAALGAEAAYVEHVLAFSSLDLGVSLDIVACACKRDHVFGLTELTNNVVVAVYTACNGINGRSMILVKLYLYVLSAASIALNGSDRGCRAGCKSICILLKEVIFGNIVLAVFCELDAVEAVIKLLYGNLKLSGNIGSGVIYGRISEYDLVNVVAGALTGCLERLDNNTLNVLVEYCCVTGLTGTVENVALAVLSKAESISVVVASSRNGLGYGITALDTYVLLFTLGLTTGIYGYNPCVLVNGVLFVDLDVNKLGTNVTNEVALSVLKSTLRTFGTVLDAFDISVVGLEIHLVAVESVVVSCKHNVEFKAVYGLGLFAVGDNVLEVIFTDECKGSEIFTCAGDLGDLAGHGVILGVDARKHVADAYVTVLVGAAALHKTGLGIGGSSDKSPLCYCMITVNACVFVSSKFVGIYASASFAGLDNKCAVNADIVVRTNSKAFGVVVAGSGNYCFGNNLFAGVKNYAAICANVMRNCSVLGTGSGYFFVETTYVFMSTFVAYGGLFNYRGFIGRRSASRKCKNASKNQKDRCCD